jgi:hypothetical protein
MIRNKKAQVWVETVIYTLIAFIMIGLLLAFANPKINELQDKTILDQSVAILEDVHTLVEEIKNVAGNKRVVDLTIRKGTFIIDGIENRIIFEMDSTQEYSESGKNITQGNVVVFTEEKGEINFVTLTSYYDYYNITYTGNDEIKTLGKSPTPYRIFLTNNGGDPPNIDFQIG